MSVSRGTSGRQTITRPEILLVATLGELGLGNESGARSQFARASVEKLHEVAIKLLGTIVSVTDTACFSCIDSRFCKHNVNEAVKKSIRRCQIGGSAGVVVAALIAGIVPLVGTLKTTIRMAEGTSGFGRSAHMGGCGGADGAILDAQAIASNPAIFSATEALMNLPKLRGRIGASFNREMAMKLKERAHRVVRYLTSNGWVGAKYVDGVRSEAPGNVEVLRSGSQDGAGIVMIYSESGTQTVSKDLVEGLGLGRWFVVNLDASRDVAVNMGRTHAMRGAVLMANIAEHLSGANRLATPQTPIVVILAP